MPIFSTDGIYAPMPAPSSLSALLESDKQISRYGSALETSPRVIWASTGKYLQSDSGNTSTNQFFATRVKTRIQGGKWQALAPVFIGSMQTLSRSPVGTAITPYTVSWALELADGTLTPKTYQSPNTGGAVVAGTFHGLADGVVRGGQIVVGDFLYASDFSLPYFEWTDREFLPWIRCAYSKTNATDDIGVVQHTEFNYYSNSYYATCTSYNNAKTLIATSGITNFNGGNNFWGSTDSDSLPSCIGFIGIPLSGQKAIFFWGTSIADGTGESTYRQGGVDPTNNLPKNYDLLGWPCHFSESLSNSVPALNYGVGGSKTQDVWSDVAADIAWSTNDSISNQRMMLASLCKFFDVLCVGDVHNDVLSSYLGSLKNLLSTVKSVNPKIKVIGVKVPNGYVDISGSTVAYNAGGLDPKWQIQSDMVTAKYMDAVISVRPSGDNKYPDLGTQVSSTTTALGTLTTLIDSGATWLNNEWTNSWVNVGGNKRLIASNTRTVLTFAALGAPVESGKAYTIEGNTSYDGVHANTVGYRDMATKFKSAIASVVSIPYFIRTK